MEMSVATGKITFLQMAMIVMLTTGLSTHVLINPMILDSTGRDAWISVILAGFLFLPWCLLLVLFMKKSGYQKFQPWLAKHTSPLISWIIVIPLCIQLYLIGGETILHTANWTRTYYLPETPRVVLILTIGLVCFYSAKHGISNIAVLSGILLPIVIVLGIFVATANIPVKDYQLLKPYLEHGLTPVFQGMIYIGGGFTEFIFILTMQHHLKNKVKGWQMILLAAMITVITIGPVTAAITEFGPIEAAKQNESPYEQWRLVKLGKYIEHLDFFSIYQWLAGASIRISLALFILADILPFRRLVMRHRFMFAVLVSYILLTLVPINKHIIYLFMYHVYYPSALVIGVVISVFCVIISLFKKHTKKEDNV